MTETKRIELMESLVAHERAGALAAEQSIVKPVCHCGEYVDDHGPAHNHAPVEMVNASGQTEAEAARADRLAKLLGEARLRVFEIACEFSQHDDLDLLDRIDAALGGKGVGDGNG